MYNNLDNEAFIDGFRSKIKEANTGLLPSLAGFINKHTTAGGGGIRDTMWNSAADGLRQMGKAHGEGLSSGMVSGAKKEFHNAVDGFKQYGHGLINNPMQTIKGNPMLTGALGVGAIGAGYYGGKALGLWGNDQNPHNNTSQPQHFASNGFSPPMMQAAYTPGYTPMALSKAGEAIPVPTRLMGSINPSIALGKNIYNAVNSSQVMPPEADHKEVVVTPENERVNKLLKNPKMRAYITSLINTSHGY